MERYLRPHLTSFIMRPLISALLFAISYTCVAQSNTVQEDVIRLVSNGPIYLRVTTVSYIPLQDSTLIVRKKESSDAVETKAGEESDRYAALLLRYDSLKASPTMRFAQAPKETTQSAPTKEEQAKPLPISKPKKKPKRKPRKPM